MTDDDAFNSKAIDLGWVAFERISTMGHLAKGDDDDEDCFVLAIASHAFVLSCLGVYSACVLERGRRLSEDEKAALVHELHDWVADLLINLGQRIKNDREE